MSFEEFVQSVDKEELEKQIMSSPKYVNLCRNAVHAVRVYIESEILMDMYENEKGDTVNLCGALKTWGERKTAEGRAEGRAETVASLVKSGLLKLEEAAEFLNLSVEDMQRNISQKQN